jgi:hypothetical protein
VVIKDGAVACLSVVSQNSPGETEVNNKHLRWVSKVAESPVPSVYKSSVAIPTSA